MVSIFIWKADQPLDQTTCLTHLHYYHGADWFLEERSDTEESASYQWIHQTSTPDYIYYAAKRMGTDWMGNTLLEEIEIPYKRWKEEGELCLEQLGSWNRVILPLSISNKSVECQWSDIQQWITQGIYPICLTQTTSSIIPPIVPSVIYHPQEYPINNHRSAERGGERGRRYDSSYPVTPYHTEQVNSRQRHHRGHESNGVRGRGGRGRGGRGRGGQGRGGRGRGGQGRGGRVVMSI